MQIGKQPESSLNRHLLVGGAALAMLIGMVLLNESSQLLMLGSAAVLFVVIFAYNLDYMHPAVTYLVPWLMILFFSTVPISRYAHGLDLSTARVLLTAMLGWLASTTAAPVAPLLRRQAVGRAARKQPQLDAVNGFGVIVLLGFFSLYVLAAANIAVSGYVPLLSLLRGGNSDYTDFGIPSVYGAFIAYANALGCLAFYAYLCGRRRIYLMLFLSVILLHLAFVTRQNLLTLLAEVFVIRCLTVGRTSKTTIGVIVVLALLGFSALGDLRSGDIKTVIGVQADYMWVPTSLVWLYAYSYFNALNLDNMVVESGAPFYDGGMWDTMLPTVLRPDVDHGYYLEISSMTVSSYIYPMYLDVGAVGVVIYTVLFGLITTVAYRRALRQPGFVEVATYACLFVCALLSFFSNFWLYLPMIFQLFFFWVFHILLFKPVRGQSHWSSRMPVGA